MNTSTRPFQLTSSCQRQIQRVVAATALALGLLSTSTMAASADLELAGVRVPAAQEMADRSLVLNGAGIRFRGPLRVYTAALYSPRKYATPEALHADAGSKRLVLTMLREVDSSQFARMFISGIQKNLRGSGNDQIKVLQALPRMGDLFAETKKLQPGDRLTLDWLPGTGLQVSLNDVKLGSAFGTQDFYSALLNIWLGPSPADWQLKDALLGKTAEAPSTYN